MWRSVGAAAAKARSEQATAVAGSTTRKRPNCSPEDGEGQDAAFQVDAEELAEDVHDERGG